MSSSLINIFCFLFSSTGVTNPGFLHVKVYNLRTQKVQVVNTPAKNPKKRGSSFSFSFRVAGAKVDLQRGSMEFSKRVEWMASSVALGFSIPLLSVLCQPRRPVNPQEYRRRVPDWDDRRWKDDPSVRTVHMDSFLFFWALGYYSPWVPINYISPGVYCHDIAYDSTDAVGWRDECEGDFGFMDTGSIGGGGGGEDGGFDAGGGDAGGGCGGGGAEGGACGGGGGGGCGGGCGGGGGGGGGDGGGGGGDGGGCGGGGCGGGCGGGGG